jgi:hypothetical protein
MAHFFSKYKYIIIAILAIFAVFIIFGMLKKPKESDSGLEKTVVATDLGAPGANGLGGGNDLGDEFVVQLLAIQNINFNTAFFSDPVYKGLKDQSRPLGDRPVGRPNPFSPIGNDDGFVGTSTAGLTGTPAAPAGANATNGTGANGGGFVLTSTSSAPATGSANARGTQTATSTKSGTKK